MRKFFSTRRRLAIAAAATVLALAGGSAAYAYFTSTGSGSGSATVGSGGTWTVAETGSTGGPLTPGDDSSDVVITFSVTNSGSGDQEFSSAVATIPTYESTTDAETSADADIAGCTASWFSAAVTSDPGLNTEVGAGDSVDVEVTVSMTDADVSQDACETYSPAVSLSIS